MKDRQLRSVISNGYRNMSQLKVSVCSIVRECERNLGRNIPKIEMLRKCFLESEVVIFENDSEDRTKEIINDWVEQSVNVRFISETFGSNTIPKETKDENPYYSMYRIERMVSYRNRYLEDIYTNGFTRDYVIIIDLDITDFDMDGIAHSFGLSDQWDVVCANGHSRSPILRKRYHDTYALIEMGKENDIQTEVSIRRNQRIWSFLKPGLPLIPVYSAYGGLAIYRYDAIIDKRYSAIRNNDKRVGAKCDHFSLCREIRNAGHCRIFINPNMTLQYQNITWRNVRKFVTNRYHSYRRHLRLSSWYAYISS